MYSSISNSSCTHVFIDIQFLLSPFLLKALQGEDSEPSDVEDNDARRGGNDDMVSDFDLMLAKKKEENSSKRKKKKDVEFINDIDDSIAKMIRSVHTQFSFSLNPDMTA